MTLVSDNETRVSTVFLQKLHRAFVLAAWFYAQMSPVMAQSRPEYYGSAIQFDVLNNQQVAEADVDYRFRAIVSGAVRSFLWYDVYKSGSIATTTCDGYGCGNGGSVDICMFGDDGTAKHLWTEKPLACVTDSTLRSGDRLRTEVFSIPPSLTAGRLYHLHWHNTDPDPGRNFISVDDTCVWHPTVPRQPVTPDSDLAVLVGDKVVATDTPIFQVNYAGGSSQGQGYKESWNYLSEEISGNAVVRETMTVGGHHRIVTSVAIRVNRVRGTDPLTVTLATAEGMILERGQIPSASFPLGVRLTASAHASQYVVPAWGTYTFSSSHTLAVGQTYQLILSGSGDSLYQAYAIQRASAYNFSASTFFGDGHGEFSHDGGSSWSGFRQTEDSVNHRDADLQFYFTVQSER